MKILFALILLVAGAEARAQAPATAPLVAPPAVVPVAKAKKPHAPKAAAAPNPNLVEAKTASGKTVHYDCSKKGNVHKVACKK